MDINRASKEGCQHFLLHFKEYCQENSFFIRVMEILDDSGYDETGN